MLNTNTPYLHVQTIRRMYRDAGKPTFAKAHVYSVIVNIGAAAVEQGTNILNIDRDSDFLWLSTYHYFQRGAYDPNTGSTAAGNQSGQEVQLVVEKDIAFTIQGTGRRLHNVEFTADTMTGAPQIGLIAGQQLDPDDDKEIGGLGGAHPAEFDNDASIGIWRGWLTEPVILPASTQLLVGIRRRGASLNPVRGHVLMLSGVRLFVGRSNV